MLTNHNLLRWGLIAGYIGIITSMLACMAIGLGAAKTSTQALQIANGAVEVKGQDGQWMPVAGASTFELIGALQSTNPWKVAGTTLETNESTKIESGLQAGNLVRVKGTRLANDRWLAYSIERADQQTNTSSTIVFIGKVDSTNPWEVNGIKLKVTPDTVITGNITPGMLVRVEVLLLEDGTWEVVSITPLGNFTEVNGCTTVAATIASVSADQIQFVGWPSMPLSKDVKITGSGGEENKQNDEQGQQQQDNEQPGNITLQPNQNVLVVLCPSQNNQIVITQIIIIASNPTDESGNESNGGEEKVLVCHKPNKNPHTLSIPKSALPAHLGHGDKLGACP